MEVIKKLKLNVLATLFAIILISSYSTEVEAAGQNIHKNNKNEYIINIIACQDSELYNKDYKRESFTSLGINVNHSIRLKGKKMPNGYEFIHNGKTYYVTRKVYETDSLRKIEDKTYMSFGDYSKNKILPVGIWPEYGKTQSLREIENKFDNLNKGNKDFEKVLYNIMKVVIDEKLEYGGDSHDQGNLSDRKTKCAGFTWIFADLLSKTDIPYRVVLVTPDVYSGKNVYHVYVEVLNKKGQWSKIECTEFAYKPGETKSDYYIKSKVKDIVNNTYKSDFRDNIDVYIDKDKVGETIKDVDYIISEVKKGDKVIDSNINVINMKTFKNSISISKNI